MINEIEKESKKNHTYISFLLVFIDSDPERSYYS